MAHTVERIALRSASAGTERSLVVHRFGTSGARPKSYVQGGLHASEVPGMIVAQHLAALLAEADARGEVVGEVVVVPAANPIGLGDTVLGVQIGRYAVASGANFNRGFVDLAQAVAPRLEATLTADADRNVGIVREAIRAVLAERKPRTEIEHLRLTLLGLAADADFVFDLHAEEDAMFAAVLAPWTLSSAELLVGDVSPDLIFYADYPQLFDTACSKPWADLAQRFGADRIPQACLSSTLELRGCGPIDDAQSRDDAAGLLAFLRRCGCLQGPPEPKRALRSQPIRFEGVEFVRAAAPGIVVYKAELGDRIAAGQVIAEIAQPFAPDPRLARVPVVSQATGVLFGRRHTMVVQADDVVAKVAGSTPLADPKHY